MQCNYSDAMPLISSFGGVTYYTLHVINIPLSNGQPHLLPNSAGGAQGRARPMNAKTE